MGFNKGDQVVAIQSFGGVARPRIEKGTTGIVTSAPWGGPLKVMFIVKSAWSGEKKVECEVYSGEIR